MGNSGSNIQNEIFNMKFTSKQLQKRYQKYEKQSKKRRQEVKKAIEDDQVLALLVARMLSGNLRNSFELTAKMIHF